MFQIVWKHVFRTFQHIYYSNIPIVMCLIILRLSFVFDYWITTCRLTLVEEVKIWIIHKTTLFSSEISQPQYYPLTVSRFVKDHTLTSFGRLDNTIYSLRNNSWMQLNHTGELIISFINISYVRSLLYHLCIDFISARNYMSKKSFFGELSLQSLKT